MLDNFRNPHGKMLMSKCRWWSEKQGGWHENLHGTCCKGNRQAPKFDLPGGKGSLFFWRQSRQEMGRREESRFRYLFLLFPPQKSPVSGFLHTSLFRGSITALSSCPCDSYGETRIDTDLNNALVWKHHTTSAPNSPCSSTALSLCTSCCFWWKSSTLLLGNTTYSIWLLKTDLLIKPLWMPPGAELQVPSVILCRHPQLWLYIILYTCRNGQVSIYHYTWYPVDKNKWTLSY